MPSGVYERKARAPKPKPPVNCCAPGCLATADRRQLRLCEMHYMRQRRHGHFDTVFDNQPPRKTAHGYLTVRAPGHPLCYSRSYVIYEHRKVFYDAHGPGPFDCHWCGAGVTWGDLHIDHLNDTKTDNRLENLVASCAVCNQARGIPKMRATMRAKFAILEFRGERLPMTEWAAKVGIAPQSIRWRLERGWPVERALTEGRGKFGPRSAT